MSIITFWSNGKKQTGQTLSIAALATQLSIEHNYKILVISTKYDDDTINNCFWQEKRVEKNLGIFGPNTNIAMENGTAGLIQMMNSNKLVPENITNYTKIIFKDRLEILPSFKGPIKDYQGVKQSYEDIINLANKYYDLVIVDLDYDMDESITENILGMSNLIVVNISQRLSYINYFMREREKRPILKSKKTLLLVGKYDKFSKYTVKNITRYMGEKNKVSTIPYNTLFFEAAEEARVPDFFLRIRKLTEEDRNGFFLAEVKRLGENIIYRLQDLQTKM